MHGKTQIHNSYLGNKTLKLMLGRRQTQHKGLQVSCFHRQSIASKCYIQIIPYMNTFCNKSYLCSASSELWRWHSARSGHKGPLFLREISTQDQIMSNQPESTLGTELGALKGNCYKSYASSVKASPVRVLAGFDPYMNTFYDRNTATQKEFSAICGIDLGSLPHLSQKAVLVHLNAAGPSVVYTASGHHT